MIPLIQRYDFFGFLRLAMDLIYTKIFFPKARIVRRPFYIRGAMFIEIGKSFTTGVGLRLDAFPDEIKKCIKIGNNVQVNDYVHIAAIESVKIGNNVLIGSKVLITDHNHGDYSAGLRNSSPLIPPAERHLYSKPILIEANVWLGESVVVLPGSKIGEGSVVGASSVVNGEIPPFSLAIGSPAKAIKKYNFQKKLWEKI